MPCRAVDSTGIKAEGEGEWHARKHGGAKRRLWRKIHIGVDEQTLEIRAIEITGSNVGDVPMLPELLSQISPDVEIGSVTADGAYDTRKCHDAVADRRAHAVIPPRQNAKPWKPSTAGAIARNEALRVSRYLGRAIWRKWSGYHRRSRAETKMHCVKLLGQSLMARDFDRQVAELQIRAAVLNGYTALGLSSSQWDKCVRGKGTFGFHPLCTTKPPAGQLPQHYSRTGSSLHQAAHSPDDGLQSGPPGSRHHRRDRDLTHDPQGADPGQRGNGFPDLRRTRSIRLSCGQAIPLSGKLSGRTVGQASTAMPHG
jgi:hypothetical protein